MLRFLKKHRKLLNKSKPPQTPAHQTTNIGAENNRDSEGEYRSRNISELMRTMGLIRLWHQIPTTEGILGSEIRAGEFKINNFPRRMSRP